MPMTLTDLNDRLAAVMISYSQKVAELNRLEAAYNLRYWHLILKSGMGNQAAREAEANLICEQEGLLVPLQILKADVKSLYYEKECLVTISANLRALHYGNEEVSHAN